jgi:hypothetical protein
MRHSRFGLSCSEHECRIGARQLTHRGVSISPFNPTQAFVASDIAACFPELA